MLLQSRRFRQPPVIHFLHDSQGATDGLEPPAWCSPIDVTETIIDIFCGDCKSIMRLRLEELRIRLSGDLHDQSRLTSLFPALLMRKLYIAGTSSGSPLQIPLQTRFFLLSQFISIAAISPHRVRPPHLLPPQSRSSRPEGSLMEMDRFCHPDVMQPPATQIRDLPQHAVRTSQWFCPMADARCTVPVHQLFRRRRRWWQVRGRPGAFCAELIICRCLLSTVVQHLRCIKSCF